MLLLLIAVPVVLLVSVAHGVLRDYAPSNMLIHAVRASRPSAAQAVGLAGLAAGLLTTAHLVTSALANGAPDWLNIVVLVLLWDAIKLAVLSVIVCVRGVWSVSGRVLAAPPTLAPGTSWARRVQQVPGRPMRKYVEHGSARRDNSRG